MASRCGLDAVLAIYQAFTSEEKDHQGGVRIELDDITELLPSEHKVAVNLSSTRITTVFPLPEEYLNKLAGHQRVICFDTNKPKEDTVRNHGQIAHDILDAHWYLYRTPVTRSTNHACLRMVSHRLPVDLDCNEFPPPPNHYLNLVALGDVGGQLRSCGWHGMLILQSPTMGTLGSLILTHTCESCARSPPLKINNSLYFGELCALLLLLGHQLQQDFRLRDAAANGLLGGDGCDDETTRPGPITAFVITITPTNTVRIAEAAVSDPLKPEVVFHLRDSFPLDAEGFKKAVRWLFFLSSEDDGPTAGTTFASREDKAGAWDRSDTKGNGDLGCASGCEGGEGMVAVVCGMECQGC